MVRYVVVGGGVAGVCCAEELCLLCPQDSVTLVSFDKVLKGISTVAKITKTIEELKVVDKDLRELSYPNFTWVQGVALGLDTEQRLLRLVDGNSLHYDKLCVCTGAQPRRLLNSPDVTVLRDTDSVADLAAQLQIAKNVVVVGNGGIALELAHALRGVNITWIVRHGHIGDAFFDLDAAQFLLEELQTHRAMQMSTESRNINKEPVPNEGNVQNKPGILIDTQQQQQQQQQHKIRAHAMGHAVGPAWTSALQNKTPPSDSSTKENLTIEYKLEVTAIKRKEISSDPDRIPLDTSSSSSKSSKKTELEVTLSDGRVLSSDVVVSVIGVDPTPSLTWVPSTIIRGPEGGLAVDRCLQTSIEGVYAAGDACCCACWGSDAPPHWFQMRLWSQARSMGIYAAHCMAGIGGDRGGDMAFEVFTHVTRFLGKKVVLLGLYNGQRLENEPVEDMVSYSRVSEGPERSFVRVLLLRGRVQGAIMIGETDLEETLENLILDGLDVSRYGPELLDPDAELDHIFD